MAKFKDKTIIDLRLLYLRESGETDTPICSTIYTKSNYIRWLEDNVLRLQNLHDKLIPWEK